MKYTATEKTYFIAHNNSDIIHVGIVEAGQDVVTGQPEFETFDGEVNWKLRLDELGYLENIQ